jgi:hypothetical protein
MEITEITAGTPATIHYYTDSRAAVVVKRTATRVYISRVETTNERNERDQLADGELPVRIADGVLGKLIDVYPQAYTLYVDRDGVPYATRGDKSIRVRFGHSRTRIDYKF